MLFIHAIIDLSLTWFECWWSLYKFMTVPFWVTDDFKIGIQKMSAYLCVRIQEMIESNQSRKSSHGWLVQVLHPVLTLPTQDLHSCKPFYIGFYRKSISTVKRVSLDMPLMVVVLQQRQGQNKYITMSSCSVT